MNAPLPKSTATLRVDLGPRSYDIHVGGGLLAAAGRLIAPLLDQPRVIVIADENTASHYLDALGESLGGAAIRHDDIVLPPGEQTKDFGHFADLIDDLLELRPDRATTLVALGGGVIGDITGFAASVTLRGVPFIQIPTTLLSQVDSAVGGKTGINTARGKNLVGSFYQPRLVIADLDTLDTLPRRELLCGYAEVVKYGVIGDAAFFAWLEAHGEAACNLDKEALGHAVTVACTAKAAIVAEDETETGRRALLNLGHTFGHALEAETGFGDTLLHGEAVAIGMVLAMELSRHMGLCRPADVDRVRGHLAKVGLPTTLADISAPTPRPDDLLAHMALDKKVRDGQAAFVLVREVGRALLSRDVGAQDVRAILDRAVRA